MKALFIASCLAATTLATATPAFATTIGTINAIYADYEVFGSNPMHYFDDGLGFSVTNSSGIAFTNAKLSIADPVYTDSFAIGTLGAGQTIYITPGVTSDGHTGHTFFTTNLGGPFDTSDTGFGTSPDSNSVPFSFTATYGSTAIDVNFTPGDTVRQSEDKTQTVNFLGNSPYNDACNQCFAPAVVATITTPTVTAVPEPLSLSLLGAGLMGMALVRRRT